MSEIHAEDCTFFLVWSKGPRNARVSHDTREAAEAEAQRLAQKHPGRKFIVVEASRKFWTDAATEAEQDAEAASAMRSAA